MQNLRGMARRRPLALGYFLIFLFTWPVDLAMAAQSQGRLPASMSRKRSAYSSATASSWRP